MTKLLRNHFTGNFNNNTKIYEAFLFLMMICRLSSLPHYYIPQDGSLQSYQDFITLLPTVDRPEAFGQHPNADITSLISESRMLFETLMSLQIQHSAADSDSKEEKVSQLAQDVQSKIPSIIDYENTEKLMGEEKTPLDVVLLQEIQRSVFRITFQLKKDAIIPYSYNILLTSISTSLEELQKGIKGLVVMSSDLEEIFICIYEGRVPSTWLNGILTLS